MVLPGIAAGSAAGCAVLPFTLTNDVHGSAQTGTKRGELWLSDDELENLNRFLADDGYQFILKPAAVKKQPPPAPQDTAKAASKEVTTPLRPPRRSSATAANSVLAAAVSGWPAADAVRVAEGGHANNHTNGVGDSRKRRRRDSVVQPEAELKKQGRTSVDAPGKAKPAGAADDSLSKRGSLEAKALPVSPAMGGGVRTSRRRRDILEGSWQMYASQVMTALMEHPLAEGFLQKTAPAEEGEPRPISLTLVNERLDNDNYHHPFRWQMDVRQVLFNEMKAKHVSDPRHKQARELAGVFEDLCRQSEGVNPYANFALQWQKSIPDIEAKKSEGTQPANKVMKERRPRPPSTMEMQELLRKAASGDLGALEKLSSIDEAMAAANAAAGVVSSPGVAARTPERTGAASDSATRKNHRSPPPRSALPPPPEAPPLLQCQNEKPQLPLQRKMRQQVFEKLDVAYRMAALREIELELDIDASRAAIDISFSPDLDLVPVSKQKIFMAYVKVLHNAQQKYQQTLSVPVTLARASDKTFGDDQLSTDSDEGPDAAEAGDLSTLGGAGCSVWSSPAHMPAAPAASVMASRGSVGGGVAPAAEGRPPTQCTTSSSSSSSSSSVTSSSEDSDSDTGRPPAGSVTSIPAGASPEMVSPPPFVTVTPKGDYGGNELPKPSGSLPSFVSTAVEHGDVGSPSLGKKGVPLGFLAQPVAGQLMTSHPDDPPSAAWGEWKQKVIQERVIRGSESSEPIQEAERGDAAI